MGTREVVVGVSDHIERCICCDTNLCCD
ncbi:hypothetical protein LCGC14_2601370, partial [marine sediment metagenome]